VHEMQRYIVESIERYTGVIIDELNVTIDSLRTAQSPTGKRV
jgi:uncharacterized alkaline shock family protein YloU